MKETIIKNIKSISYKRDFYLTHLKPFLNKPVIKVLTGMRRVGKSVLLRQVAENLAKQNTKKRNIFFIDKEDLEFENIATYHDLNREVKNWFKGCQGSKYLFVDEIQEIDGWERAIVSLMKIPDLDILISGSNAHMLSSEIATLLSGRYIEIPIYPLCFDEFLQFRQAGLDKKNEEFKNYLHFGGLPGIHYFPLTDSVVFQYIQSLYSTILLKDVIRRHQVRHLTLLENMFRYVCDNIGNCFSANRIADYLKSQHMKMGVETVINYMDYLAAARLVFRASRFDIKGKRHLDLTQKYFLGDIGLRHSLLGFREGELSGVLENIVYLELLRRGYRVSIGKLAQLEIDFVATKENKKIYIQVAYSLASPKTVDREFKPLLSINDNYPKYVLSTDEIFGADYKGINRLSVVDFLINQSL